MKRRYTSIALLLVCASWFVAGCGNGTQQKDHDHHGHHHHHAVDPHIWHDPKNAIHSIGQIRDALKKKVKGTSGKPKVVATFSVLGDWVKNVGGEDIELITLVGADGDAHTFEPTASDAKAVANADLVFEIGIGFETWLDKLYKSSESKGRRVVVSRGLELIESEHHHHHHEDDDEDGHHDEDEDHDHNEKELDLVTSEFAEQFETRATKYIAELNALDQFVQDEVKKLPIPRRILVTNHDTFGYFARRYDFKVPATVLASFSSEANDPSPKTFARLIRKIKVQKVPAIFAENTTNPKLTERLAKEADVKLGPPLYTDALGESGTDGETYLKMMRYNVTTIVENLKAD
ncbi:MAG: metal ABC transporter solute-binding protein, Zn/Mn family [Gemmataceae bacterium]